MTATRDSTRSDPATVVTAVVTATTLVAGLLMSRDRLGWYALNAVFFVLLYTVPARSIRSLGDVRVNIAWYVVLCLAATVVWDWLDAHVRGARAFLGDWPIVYIAAPLFFVGLLVVHGVVVGALRRRAGRP